MIKLTEKQVQGKLDFIKNYVQAQNAATGSLFDANANVDSKNIATLEAELYKDFNVQINRGIISSKIKELYSDKLAIQYNKDIENHSQYVHDETSLKPYCVSVNMWRLLEDGMTGLGGESKAPEHLNSFCGTFVNFVFAVAAQFAGACLYKNQNLIIQDKNIIKSLPIKELIDSYNLNKEFINYQGKWKYKNVEDKGLKVWENGKYVNIKKLYKREYKDNIFIIKTASGKKVEVSKDHIFKVMYKERWIECKAKDLKLYDTVINTTENFTIEKNKDYREGQMIGIIAGDGSITGKDSIRVSINYKEKFIADKLDELFLEFYQKKGNLDKGNRCYDYRLHSRKILKHVQSYFKDGYYSYEKFIDISKYNLNFLLGFLDGLLVTDGSWNNQHRISLTSEKLVENIQEILEKIGIFTFISEYQSKRKNKKMIYSIGFSNRINKHLEMTLERRKNNQKFQNTNSNEISYSGKYCNFINKSKDYSVTSRTKKIHEDILDVITSIEIRKNDDDYVYEIETDTNWYSAGGILTHNCATVEFLNYFDYFARRDYGNNYLETHTDLIANHLQHVVYAINQPAAARGYQSVFWNISIYDEPYFDAMFGNFYFPDFTKSNWDSVNRLQNFFMKWFNKERTKSILTYPVVTAACLSDGENMVDKDFEDMIAEELSEGNSFFIFMSEDAQSLSSCCFSEEQKCLTKSSNGVNYMTFKELKNSSYEEFKRNFTIFHNGSWVKGKLVELPKRQMYEIITSNNKKVILSDNHINVTLDGEIETSKLKKGDKLLFNNLALDTFYEKDEGLTYEEGFVIGAFLGDGSFASEVKGTIHDIQFSMGEYSYKKMMKCIDKISNIPSKLSKVYNNVYPVRVSDKNLAAKIIRWTKWERGTYAYNKKLNLDCLLQSVEFRQGILDGWYHTDGGNSNRCYTSSPELAENMEVLITSLGKNSVIDISDRTDEPVIIRGKEFNRNYPLYCVRWYDPQNKRSMKNVYTVKNNSIYFDIKSIRKIDYDKDNIYCFEMENKNEPYFTLPNGIITHNCRLKSDISDNINEFSYSLGAGGVATGSINVITLNINYIIQEAYEKGIDFLEYLEEKVDNVHKYQIAYRHVIDEYKDAGMLPVYDAGFISLDKQFLTIGINGLVEAAEFLNIEISDNKEYRTFIESVLKLISDKNKAIKKETGYKFNTEFVPAENLGVKNSKWDKKRGFKVNRDCYNSYLYKVEDDSVSVLDKFSLHGKQFMQYLDGGSAYHCNLEEYPTKDGFKKLLAVAAKVGCEYFCFNVKVTICNDCGCIDKRTHKSCSKCGSKNVDYATRIIGYLKRISSFSADRQKEAALRDYTAEKDVCIDIEGYQ